MNGLSGAMHAAIVAVCNGVLQLIIAFGVNLNSTQDATISGFINAFIVLIALVVGGSRRFKKHDAKRALNELSPDETQDVIEKTK